MTRSDIGHWWRVARYFHPLTEAFWCGLAHDLVEDGYAPRLLLRWRALDAVTRRDGEKHFDYIARASRHPVGREVKFADLMDNLRRDGGPPGDLRERYLKAIRMICFGIVSEGVK